ncbi:MAG: hypothetical protein ACPGRD_12275, partial [Planktomarina sp.]
QGLSQGGGSALMQVDVSDAEMVEAIFDTPEGLRIHISCTTEATTFSIGKVGFREPFAGLNIELAAIFDGEPEIKLGHLTYAGGNYWLPLQPQILTKIVTRKSAYFYTEDMGLQFELPLDGAANAIQSMTCLGGKP